MSRHIVITGGNRGIGLELVKNYASNGDNVTVLCRQSSKELDTLDVSIITNVDVTDMASILNARQQLRSKKVDILINNAGLLTQESIVDCLLWEYTDNGNNNIRSNFFISLIFIYNKKKRLKIQIYLKLTKRFNSCYA